MRESIDNCINVRHFAIKTLINISRAHTRGTSNSPRIVLALTRKIAHQGEKIFACHKYSKKSIEDRSSKVNARHHAHCVTCN